MLGTAGQALASELPTGTAVQGGPQEEVPWTAPDPEVPWTGPIQIVVTGAGGIATVVLDTIEVPWT
jgi:hypothetical protein